jgi:DNA-binding response OmpR family regulator
MQVLTELREAPSTAWLPVIVVTAQEDEALEAKLMNAGADDYIRKPLEPSRFAARVKAALRRARA